MSRRLRLVALTISLLALAVPLQVVGQVSAVTTADVRPSPEVLLEAKVLGIPAAGLSQLGLVLPESASGTLGSPTGFAVILPADEAQALLEDSRTRTVHTLKLQGSPGNPLKFRVDTRALANPNSPSENPPYFEVGIAFEVTPGIYPSRNVGLSTVSTVQIRRGPGPAGGVVPLLFETPPIKHDIQIPEGKTILLGGFLTSSNSTGLPIVPMIEGNPILGYVLSKTPRKGDDPEIVVLLTPRLSGVTDDAKKMTSLTPAPTEPVVKAEVPAASSTPVLRSDSSPKLDLPAAGPDLPAVSVPPITKSTASTPVTSSAPAVSPAAVPKPALTSQTEARFYSVQVGAFGSSTNAEALVAELKKNHDVVFVDKASSGRVPYRVRVGRLSGLTAAKQLQAKLTEQGFSSFVVPPDTP